MGTKRISLLLLLSLMLAALAACGATTPAAEQSAELKTSATNETPNGFDHPPNDMTSVSPRIVRVSNSTADSSITATLISMTLR